MALTFRADFPQTRDALRQIVGEHRAVRDRVLTGIGFVLLNKQKLHFGQLVRTGSANGVTWPKAAPATLRARQSLARRGMLQNVQPDQIGYRSGSLLGGFRFRVNLWGRRVVLTNRTEYAGAFSTRRPLYPTTIPSEWMDSAERSAQTTLDKHYGGIAARPESEFDRLMKAAKARYA